MLTVLTVFSGPVRILITLVPARPSRPKAMWIPSTRRNVSARRKRPRDRAGVLGPTSGPARGGRELECGFTFRREPADLISMSSQVTRVSAPARARAASKAQIPDLRRDSARRSYRSMAVSCRSQRTVAMHLNVDDTRPKFASIRRRSSHRGGPLCTRIAMATLLVFRALWD
jgi:hypothetical protein